MKGKKNIKTTKTHDSIALHATFDDILSASVSNIPPVNSKQQNVAPISPKSKGKQKR